MDEKGKCYIVTSEGAHYADGTYIAAGEAVNDGFGHAVLGGAGENLKNMSWVCQQTAEVLMANLQDT